MESFGRSAHESLASHTSIGWHRTCFIARDGQGDCSAPARESVSGFDAMKTWIDRMVVNMIFIVLVGGVFYFVGGFFWSLFFKGF